MQLRARLATIAGFSLVLSTAAVAPVAAAAPAPGDVVPASTLTSLVTPRADDAAHAYSRDQFTLWIDADGDGCNTRYEVLIAESTTPVTVGAGCSLTGGTWVSPYDGATWTAPADVDIDHVVPLADAWRSGAWAWTADQRTAYANDLDVPYALIAVTDNVNQSKGDKDPAQWMPPSAGFDCQYAIDWALVKYRWSLSADPAELSALTAQLSGTCGDTEVTLPPVMATQAPSDPGTPPATITPFGPGTTRVSGASRYDTAVAASQRFAPGVPAVFVATGLNFPDALSAAAAVANIGGPLLLTAPNALPSAVAAEITRLAPENIYLIGGTGAVSDAVYTTLSGMATTTRLSGADRYATSLAIVKATFSTPASAFIATGASFPDALAASGAAGGRGAPVILVDGSKPSLSPAALQALSDLGVTDVTIAGGTGAVSAGIEQQLRTAVPVVNRYGGASRYDTALQINNAFYPAGSTDTLFLATGTAFPDALSGAALAGQLHAPLFITQPRCVPENVRDGMVALGASSRVVMGGTGAVTAAAAGNYACLIAAIPRISGTAKVGSTLTASPGGWTPGTTFTYQWFADGAALTGGSTLALTAAQQGKRITVRVTGSKPGFVPVSTTSAATAPVAGNAPTPPPPPPPPTKPANPGDTKNCSDFANWNQANAWFQYYYPYYGDVARLDADHDGIPCESLPGAP